MAEPAGSLNGKTGFIQGLGLLEATTLVMGSMIGSGIFIVSADIARQVASPGLLLTVWVVSSLITVMAALSYGELAAAMPHAGGQYVFLREAFGPLWGFLYGWALFLVIQTGTIAAVAVAFAKFTGLLLPVFSEQNTLADFGVFRFTTQQALAMAVMALLTGVNMRGVRTGSLVQNVFTIAKTGALVGLIVLGLALGRNPEAIERNFGAMWNPQDATLAAIRLVGVALVGALFSSDAWNNVTFAAAEVRHPHRNLPLALGLGTGLVCLLYLLTNAVYLTILPLEAIQSVPEDRVGTAAAAGILGDRAVTVMALAIMVSTFGCLNGLILAGARVYYAMAQDGLFFRQVGKLDPVHHAPSRSLLVQCLWACGLTLTGTYSDLLDFVMFAVMLFYLLTVVGLFVLRRKRPAMPRPYRAVGYPVLPALYIALVAVVEVILLLYKPRYTWPGLLLVLLGVPVYFLWRRAGRRAPQDTPL